MVATIVGMATGIVVSAISQSILNNLGEQSKAQKVNFFTECSVAGVAIVAFVKLTKSLLSLG